MMAGALAFLSMAVPTLASAQVARDIPSGSPLGAADVGAAQAEAQAAAQAQAAARARYQAAARARSSAPAMTEAFAAPPQTAEIDEGRMRPATSSYGQTDTPARATPSPYGGYYQIRTPWDRR